MDSTYSTKSDYVVWALLTLRNTVRTASPGLTVIGIVEAGTDVVDLTSRQDWQAQVDNSILLPTGLIDDVSLHVSPLHQPREIC